MKRELRERIEAVFGSLVVDKRAALLGGLERTPRFVTEYLIAAAREKNAGVDLAVVRDRIRKYSVDADRQKEFISRLMREGRASLIALLEVEPRPDQNLHIARIAQLGGASLGVEDALIEDNPELLYGGMWGNIDLAYDTTGNKPRMVVTGFLPYQLSRPDTDVFKRARARFSFDEWVDLMISSAGFRPEGLPTLRHKLLFLCRLVPLSQDNVNLVELGPRNTGKSYLLRNLSARVFLLAGARATPAALFYDLNKNRVGILGVKKAVIFDEVNATQFPDPTLIAALLDYMESGSISRAGKSLTGDCSLVFSGNLDLSPDGRFPHSGYPHLFHAFPRELATPAIVDRIHGFLPGWELPKISDRVLSDDLGLLSDYFGEVLSELRRDPMYLDLVRARVDNELAGELTIRDKQRAITRVAAGLTRILFPDGRIEEEGFREVLRVAVELRMRVHQQLLRMAPGEYKPKQISVSGAMPELPEERARHKSPGDYDRRANEEDLVGTITILYVIEGTGGGSRGFVECSHLPGRGLEVTGLHGKVLSESIKASYSALVEQGNRLGLPAAALRAKRMSIHLVNIAENRDGPSAGLAFALAMISAAIGRPIKRGLAVTGELSLKGHVNAVGGIAEKLSAAKAHGRRLLIIPEANREDLLPIPEVVEGLDLRLVRTLEEAAAIALV